MLNEISSVFNNITHTLRHKHICNVNSYFTRIPGLLWHAETYSKQKDKLLSDFFLSQTHCVIKYQGFSTEVEAVDCAFI